MSKLKTATIPDHHKVIEAIGLVLATLNLDDVYPSQRELLREVLEDAKQTQDMLKLATDAAYQKGYADAMNWKLQNHLEHLPAATETYQHARLMRVEEESLWPVQVSIEEFMMRVAGNEGVVGKPVIWTQWPKEAKPPKS